MSDKFMNQLIYHSFIPFIVHFNDSETTFIYFLSKNKQFNTLPIYKFYIIVIILENLNNMLFHSE